MTTLNTTVLGWFGNRPTSGTFGIEIETEGQFPGIISHKQWDVKNDGSLRNGLEFVSKPVKDVRAAVTGIGEVLKASGAVLNPSYRCSTHIHYNYQSRTFKDVCALMIAWAALEPLFLRQMPPGRDGSIYCMSGYDTGDLPFFFDQFCNDIRTSFRLGFRGRNKYSSLNILRLQDLGTVEFRIFPSSIDPEKIGTWADWIVNLDTLSQKYDDMLKMVRYIERNPVTAAAMVFGGKVPVSDDECGLLIDLGCKTAHEMARVFQKVQARPAVAAKKSSEIHIDEVQF